MTEQADEQSLSSQSNSSIEPITLVEPASGETIAALVEASPLIDSSTITNSRDNSPPSTRRRSSVSIIQALANTRHLLTTHDARKR